MSFTVGHSRWVHGEVHQRSFLLATNAFNEHNLSPFVLLTLSSVTSFTGSGLTIRSPPFHTSPNTDGINLRAHGVHVSGCDITNGDDSVVLKAPSKGEKLERRGVQKEGED